jgi:hypothetical protein
MDGEPQTVGASRGSAIDRAASWLGRRPLMLFGAFFALVLVLRFWTLNQPPVWDGAGGLFPAAGYLADTGFDLPGLLSEPRYLEGGPNVHALSAVTLVTAVFIAILGDTPTLLPALHLAHLLLGAAVGVGVYRLGRHALPGGVSLLVAIASVSAPVMATQIGDIYLDLPAVAAAVWAAVWWIEGRLGWSLAAAVAGTWVKDSGLIVAGALALAEWLTAREDGTSTRWAWWYLAAPAGMVAANRLVIGIAGVDDGRTFDLGTVLTALGGSLRSVGRVPDVALLILLYAVLRPFLVERAIPGADTARARQVERICGAVLGSTLLFYLALGGFALAVLPRYLTLILPFLLLGLASLARRLLAPVRLEIATSLVVLVFAVNGAGLLYPPADTNNFASVERSAEYRELLALQIAVTDAIVDVPDEIPVFYPLVTHFRAAYPVSTYVEEPVTNGVNVFSTSPYDAGHLADFPDDFVLVIDHERFGGDTMVDVWEQAEADQAYATTVVEMASGEFRAVIVRITRNE